jgi:hypothetical protein
MRIGNMKMLKLGNMKNRMGYELLEHCWEIERYKLTNQKQIPISQFLHFPISTWILVPILS